MILRVRAFAKNPDTKNINQVATAFGIKHHTASSYIQMTEEEVLSFDSLQVRNKRATPADNYLNIIYKMQLDGYQDDVIYHYVIRHGYEGSPSALWKHIYHISRNNFPDRKTINYRSFAEWHYPEDIIVIKRVCLLRYILTINPKKKRDETISCYIEKIKEKYPVVEVTERMFSEFHAVIMGKNADALSGYLEKYGNTKIAGLCNGIKKDIIPVRNAISMEESSGFVEGNNNKFKLIKRILFGRAGLINLTKKCKLAFEAKKSDFSLADLL